jgi:glucosyl-3-phosphoglycerate synthase
MLPPVREWFDTHSFSAEQFEAAALRGLKGSTRISVVIPARDEEATIAAIVRTVVDTLMGPTDLVDQLVVMDSRSLDATASVAAAAGATVVAVDEVLPELGREDGKGEALWKSLHVTDGDLLVFLDGDLRRFSPRYVLGLLGPLLTDPGTGFVKAAYDRTVSVDRHGVPLGGGRVTELVARPLLNAHWPLLAGFVQPLAGEYAARRDVLAQVPFACGYGVELGLLVDVLDVVGLAGMAQVDLGARVHRNRPDDELGPMAAAIWQTAAARLRSPATGTQLTTYERRAGRFAPLDTDLAVAQRPPYGSVRLCSPAS